MEKKHTPGPWVIRAIDLHEGGSGFEVVGANGELVCDNQTYYPHAIEKKNARLIEAAPDLLEALIAVEDFISGKTDAVEPFGIVRDAIAKATGEYK